MFTSGPHPPHVCLRTCYAWTHDPHKLYPLPAGREKILSLNTRHSENSMFSGALLTTETVHSGPHPPHVIWINMLRGGHTTPAHSIPPTPAGDNKKKTAKHPQNTPILDLCDFPDRAPSWRVTPSTLYSAAAPNLKRWGLHSLYTLYLRGLLVTRQRPATAPTQ